MEPVILQPSDRVLRPGPGAFPGWDGFARPAWLLALVAGLLVVGFQSRLSPRPPHAGPAKLSYASVAPVKFPMPERQEPGPDQSCELAVFAPVPPVSGGLAETVPGPSQIAGAVSRTSTADRAPPGVPGLL